MIYVYLFKSKMRDIEFCWSCKSDRVAKEIYFWMLKKCERESPRTTAMARKQETIKANCRRSDGRQRMDVATFLGGTSEMSNLKNFLEGKKE